MNELNFPLRSSSNYGSQQSDSSKELLNVIKDLSNHVLQIESRLTAHISREIARAHQRAADPNQPDTVSFTFDTFNTHLKTRMVPQLEVTARRVAPIILQLRYDMYDILSFLVIYVILNAGSYAPKLKQTMEL
jgi:hypothetical protein